jgi:uncharacterized protein (DUF362 family)
MKLHPELADPRTVVLFKRPVSAVPTPAEFAAAAEEALAAIGLELEGELAVLKPNVTAGEHNKAPDSGITTHHAFMRGMIAYLLAHGADPRAIHIVEDPFNSDTEQPPTWAGTGYVELARDTGALLSCPTRATVRRFDIPNPLAEPTRLVSTLATDPANVYINVPKLKTHNLGITTLCMKNQQGIAYVLERHFCREAMDEMEIPEDVRRQPRQEWMDEALHRRWQLGLAHRLADLAKVAVPRLNVVEGVVGRDGTGFNHGRNFPLGLVAMGTGMVAVDTVVSYLMGFNPEELIYLQVAAEAGLGSNRLAEQRVLVVRDGALAPCDDLSAWRFDPPFEVIRNVREG